MAFYKVEIKASAQKEIRKLPTRKLRSAIVDIIIDLENNPRPNKAKKIKGSNNIYRIRKGSFRIIYEIRKSELIVIVIKS